MKKLRGRTLTNRDGRADEVKAAPSAPAKRRRAKSSVEAELWRLLRKCHRLERQELLRQFSETQRRALERWILSRPKGKRSTTACKKRRCLGHLSPRSFSGVPGIESHLRQGKLRYRAVVKFGPFRILTGYCEDLLLAKRRLQQLQDLCGEAPESGPEVLEGLRKALTKAKNTNLELRFFALLPCRRFKTPCLKVEGLEAGLRAWQELGVLLRQSAGSPEEAWNKAQSICNELWACVNGGRKRVVKRREAPKNFGARHHGVSFAVQQLLNSWHPSEKGGHEDHDAMPKLLRNRW